mgnify:CR=1 FL=1
MRMLYHVMSAPAPLGLLFMAASEKGLQVVEYMDRRSLKRTLADHTVPGMTFEASLHGLRPLADQVDEYFTGARQTFEWALAPIVEDPLTLAVLRAIRRVPYGTTCKVSELAKQVGQPRATKDVLQAVLRNPLAVIIPCHRIVGADGKPLEGVGGLARRKALLETEQRFSQMGRLDDNRVIGELVRRTAAGTRLTATSRPEPKVSPKTTATATRKPAAAKAPTRASSGGTATLTARATTKTTTARKAVRTPATVRASAKKRSR